MDGTTHLLPENCLAAAAMLRRDHDLDKEAACGVIWWRRRQQQLEMLPVVHVRDAGTDFLEGACGSGALALAFTPDILSLIIIGLMCLILLLGFQSLGWDHILDLSRTWQHLFLLMGTVGFGMAFFEPPKA